MSRNLFLLAQEANSIAREHGFWEPTTCKAPVATKVALIHTEIEEYRESETLEELADIVIRALDLAVAMDIAPHHMTIPDVMLAGRPLADALALELHRLAAAVTQADRKDDHAAAEAALMGLVEVCFRADVNLWPAVEAKMARNRDRPRLHDRRY